MAKQTSLKRVSDEFAYWAVKESSKRGTSFLNFTRQIPNEINPPEFTSWATKESRKRGISSQDFIRRIPKAIKILD